MRLRTKLTLGILVAAVLPLAIAGFSGARLSEQALRQRIEASHRALASNAAANVQQFFSHKAEALRVVPQLTDLRTATPEVVTGLLRVAYRSTEDFAVIALLDSEGKEVVDSVYLPDPTDALATRAGVGHAELAAFLSRVPITQSLSAGQAIGRVERTRTGTRCAVAIAFTADTARYVLAADVSLARIDAQLKEISVSGVKAVLVDGTRAAVAGSVPGAEGVPLPLPGAGASALPTQPEVATVRLSGEATLAGFAPATGTPFGVLVVQSETVAFAAVRGLRQRTLLWLGTSALLAILAGIGLARGLSRRVASLAAGTAALAMGDFEARLIDDGSDELAELADSFNRMAQRLGDAADDIRQKNEEITRWNEELEERVAKKSQELERAQGMVLRSRSLAAIGTLGAGMAHEINNPLTGVLGSAQLLAADAEDGSTTQKYARDIESCARRIRDIVANLQGLAQRQPDTALSTLDLNTIVTNVISLVGVDLKNEHIKLSWHKQEDLPEIRGNPHRLQEMVIELIANARRAMSEGGQLALTTGSTQEHAVTLRVSDTGPGISQKVIDRVFDPFFTTKENWTSTGMGLTLVHKIVEEHEGKIDLDSIKGHGATFTLTFPTKPDAHLK